MPSWSTNSSSPTISSPHRFFMLDAPTPDDLTWSTAGDLAAEVTAGRLKALEIVEVTLARIRARSIAQLVHCRHRAARARTCACPRRIARERQTAWTASRRAVRG